MQCVVIVALINDAPVTRFNTGEYLAIHAVNIKDAAGSCKCAKHNLPAARDQRDIFGDCPGSNHADIAVGSFDGTCTAIFVNMHLSGARLHMNAAQFRKFNVDICFMEPCLIMLSGSAQYQRWDIATATDFCLDRYLRQ